MSPVTARAEPDNRRAGTRRANHLRHSQSAFGELRRELERPVGRSWPLPLPTQAATIPKLLGPMLGYCVFGQILGSVAPSGSTAPLV